MIEGLSGGSEGLLTGRYSQYWNTGKGSTWEGGMHEAGVAYWKGTIEPMSRSAEIVSSLDLFPTASALAGVPLPVRCKALSFCCASARIFVEDSAVPCRLSTLQTDRVYDGKDMSDVLIKPGGKSKHKVRCMYGTAFLLRFHCISFYLRRCLSWTGALLLRRGRPGRQRPAGGPDGAVEGVLGDRPRPGRLPVGDLQEAAGTDDTVMC
eukprot:SAG22_NODE_43_length_25304_cov_5.394644_10_plen_208_part_00